MQSRHLDTALQTHFSKYKEILVLLGPRQAGKTTLVKRIFPTAQYLLLDNEPLKRALESYDINVYKQILKKNNQPVVLDEIQLLSNPGRAAKIIYDQMPEMKLIITGSNSLHIKNKTGESLAGRKRDYYLYPLTFSEYLTQNRVEETLNYRLWENLIQPVFLHSSTHLFDLQETLKNVLLYGLFPQLVNYPKDKNYLQNFAETLIFKDLLELDLIDNRRAALDLLKLLAYQIGGLVNYAELATRIGLDQRTVRRYLEIFEQSFIIYRLYPYSQRRRDEIVKSPKIYFWDTGVRNALINNFDNLNLRPDKGALFENFIISEAKKAMSYQNVDHQAYYWRTKQGAETNLVLSNNESIFGIEIKTSKKTAKQNFAQRYPQATAKIVNQENFY